MQFAVLTLALALINIPAAKAQNWELDSMHSNIKFSVKYLKLSDVDGRFTDFKATLSTKDGNFKDLKDAKVTTEIAVKSINTDIAKRDEHLRSPDFFDEAKYPKITFVSTGIKALGDNNYEISGKLTMKNVTKDIVLKAQYLGLDKDGYGMTRAMWHAEGMIKRYDYGIKFNKVTEAGSILISDEVKIGLNLQFIKK